MHWIGWLFVGKGLFRKPEESDDLSTTPQIKFAFLLDDNIR